MTAIDERTSPDWDDAEQSGHGEGSGQARERGVIYLLLPVHDPFLVLTFCFILFSVTTAISTISILTTSSLHPP